MKTRYRQRCPRCGRVGLLIGYYVGGDHPDPFQYACEGCQGPPPGSWGCWAAALVCAICAALGLLLARLLEL